MLFFPESEIINRQGAKNGLANGSSGKNQQEF
jgi:hypothetical protein